MADPEHVEVVKRGAAAIAEWRQENPGVILDLGKANFRYANLRGGDLSGADLSGAHLRRRLTPGQPFIALTGPTFVAQRE